MSENKSREANLHMSPVSQLSLRWWPYVLAVAVTLATLALRLSLAAWIGDRPVLILFVIPIFLSASMGGQGPGLVSTMLVALGTGYFVMPPTHTFAFERPVDFAQWLILILTGGLISVLTESRRSARRNWQGELAPSKHLTTERKVQGGFGFALACLGVIGVVSYLSVVRLREDAARVQHTHEVIFRLELLLSTAIDAETGQRGYVITGDESYLEPYRQAVQVRDADLRRLRELVADNPAQQRRLELLVPLVDERLAACGANIEMRRSQGFEAAQRMVLAGRGKRLQDQIRLLVDEMEGVEETLLQERELRARRSTVTTQTVIIGGSVLAFGFVGLALFTIRRDFAGRERAEEELREAKAQLEVRVRDRTTELAQTNAALRKSEAQLQTIVENLNEGVAVSDLEGQLLHFNRAALAMHGFASLEEGRRRLPEFADTFELTAMDGTVWSVEQWPLARILRGENLHDLEVRIRRIQTGWQRVFSYGGTLVNDAAGQPLLAVVTISDITERKRAEETVRESERRLQFALEVSHIGGWELDLAKHTANRSLQHDQIFGYESLLPEWTYEKFLEHVVPEDRDLVDQKFRLAVAEQRGWDFECRIVRRDQVVRWISATGRLRRDEHGQTSQLAGIVQDITARKRAEQEIRELNTTLERRVVQRTEELAAANKELETFAYSVSHDLRAPLRGIAGFTEALARDHRARLDAEGGKYLDRVIAATDRMGQLIDDLLNLSRVTRADFSRRTVDLSAMARDIAEHLRQTAPHRPAEFLIADDIKAEGDPRLLHVVLENLLGNAWKFTSKKPATRIEFAAMPGPDGQVTCYVRDNGAGFDMNYAAKLFGPFQRLHSLSEFPGTGIGLATVQRIIQRHGGRVWAVAQIDAGATFSFSF